MTNSELTITKLKSISGGATAIEYGRTYNIKELNETGKLIKTTTFLPGDMYLPDIDMF